MLQVPIKEIPKETSRVLEIDEIATSDLAQLFGGVEEFSLVQPDDFEATVRVQMIGESIRVAGYVAAKVAFDCGRCLEHRVVDLDAEMEYMLVSRDEWEREHIQLDDVDPRIEDDEEEGGLELQRDDLDIAYYEGEEVDLRPYLREALLLELPPFAVCPPQMSQQCQSDYEENVGKAALEKNEDEGLDPRWAKLRELKEQRAENNDE